jgi:prepilin-type N-terminal cleavage/methylation domain-containing protein
MLVRAFSEKVRAFSLIEMIGVLAIFGLLAAIIAPKVYDNIRASKVSAALTVHEAARGAAAQYIKINRTFPVDGSVSADPGYSRPYGDGAPAPLNAGQTTIGDLFIQQGLLERFVLPIGARGETPYLGGLSLLQAVVGTHGTLTNPGVDFPMIFCNTFSSSTEDTKAFSGASFTTRVVFMLIPGLTTLEAGEVKNRVDGPFRNEAVSGLADLVTRAVAADSGDLPAVRLGNCRLTSGLQPGTYDCWLYVAHD